MTSRYCALLMMAAGAASAALMPLPAKMELREGSLAIKPDFAISTENCSDPAVRSAAGRLAAQVVKLTGIPIVPASAGAALEVACAAPVTALRLGVDESYTLAVSPTGARIDAPTAIGALRGMATFAQTIEAAPEGFAVRAVRIDDRPRFPWRGLMIDSSRHFMPVELIKRNLDAMAAVKLNVLHWHLSDDQGFRAESRRYERLHQQGSDGRFYTQAQLREIVAFARDRGIRVVPEFDIPGHTTSWMVGYPDLASAPGPYSIERRWGIFEPTMDPSREQTFAFLDRFLGEMAEIFPDEYFHIGGDEVKPTQWNQSAAIQAWARKQNLKDAHAIQAYFNQRLLKILEKHGKIMIGWDEILHPDLPTASVIHSWRGAASLADAAAKGYRGILSSGYYLDHLRPASFHYAVDPLGGPAANLTAEQAARILGGEACMWAEYVSEETVESRIWPRMAAIAERLWSPKETTDVDSMYGRLAHVSRYLESVGIRRRDAAGNPLLDRLTGGEPAEPVRVLAEAFEPLGIGGRARAQRYTSLVPLNRFVDALPAESELVRALEKAAAQSGHAALRAHFTRWAANDAQFQPLAKKHFLLAELASASKDLSALGAMGLRLLDAIDSGRRPPEPEIAAMASELARMQKPVSELSLAAARPVKLLLDRLRR